MTRSAAGYVIKGNVFIDYQPETPKPKSSRGLVIMNGQAVSRVPAEGAGMSTEWTSAKEKDVQSDAEGIACPYCWPDDSGCINYRLRVFLCTHCGTRQDFGEFATNLRNIRDQRALRVVEDDALLTRVCAAIQSPEDLP